MKAATANTSRRRYTMRARAASAHATREKILDAAVELFLGRGYADTTLTLVAEAAGVSLQTVMRYFATKDELMLAAAEARSTIESEKRAKPPGEGAAVAHVLADRYEDTGRAMMQFVAVEDRVDTVAAVLARARESHRQWLATVFADALPRRRGPLRERRLAQLFGVTELYVWVSWRRRLGMTRAHAERAMAETLDAVLASWTYGMRKRDER